MLAAADLARRARRAADGRSRRAGRADRAARPAAAGRRSLGARGRSRRSRRDKKVVAGTLHFVLPTAIGATTTVDDVTEDELTRGAGGDRDCKA